MESVELMSPFSRFSLCTAGSWSRQDITFLRRVLDARVDTCLPACLPAYMNTRVPKYLFLPGLGYTSVTK